MSLDRSALVTILSPSSAAVGRDTRSDPPAKTASGPHVRGFLRHHWPAWLGVLSAVVIFGDGGPQEFGGLAWVLMSMPVVYLAFGAIRGELREPRAAVVQVTGLLAFGTLGLVVLSTDRDLGRYLLATGWLAHGVWDLVHYRARRVVPRQWAEWCGVVDVLGAAAILAL